MISHRILLAFLLVVLPTAQASSQPSEFVLIENVNVIDIRSGEIAEGALVLLSGDRIEAVGREGAFDAPEGARHYDAEGRFLIPGLIDTHVHPAWHLDDDLRLDADEVLENLYLSHGITGIRDASIPGQEERALRAREDSISGARVLPRIHVAGRVDSTNVKKQGVADTAELLVRLTELGVDSFKIRNGIRTQELQAITEFARATAVPVWGHTYEGNNDYSKEALIAGVHGITHILGINPRGSTARPNPQPSIEDWEASWIYGATNWLYEDLQDTTALIDLMVEQNAWFEPTLVTEYFVSHADELAGHPANALLRSDYEAMRLGFPVLRGTDVEAYKAAFKEMQRFVYRFHAAGGWLIAGTDNLPWEGAGLHLELELLVDAGVPPLGALQAATINAARALGWEDVGAIEPGMQADLVLLDANPLDEIKNTWGVHAVISRGRWLDRSQLDEMLSRVKATP